MFGVLVMIGVRVGIEEGGLGFFCTEAVLSSIFSTELIGTPMFSKFKSVTIDGCKKIPIINPIVNAAIIVANVFILSLLSIPILHSSQLLQRTTQYY